MDRVNVAHAKSHLSELIHNVGYGNKRVTIQKRKKPLVVVLSYSDYKQLEQIEDMFESELLRQTLQNKGKKFSLAKAVKRLKIEL